jgi:hypothetical protein
MTAIKLMPPDFFGPVIESVEGIESLESAE